jgi:mono/diheme cytochrome c family protein
MDINFHLEGASSPRRVAAVLVTFALLVAGCGSAADPEAEARMTLGRNVFTESAQPTCGICHTLQDAGSNGQIGPNLDELRPDRQRVVAAVSNGVGAMPAQKDNLSEEQIEAVAYYVAQVTGSANR